MGGITSLYTTFFQGSTRYPAKGPLLFANYNIFDVPKKKSKNYYKLLTRKKKFPDKKSFQNDFNLSPKQSKRIFKLLCGGS